MSVQIEAVLEEMAAANAKLVEVSRDEGRTDFGVVAWAIGSLIGCARAGQINVEELRTLIDRITDSEVKAKVN